jgi:hypothetical protein
LAAAILATPLALLAALTPSTPAVAAPPGHGGGGPGGGVFEPSAPYNATFFYPWYSNGSSDGSFWQHWQGSVSPNVSHTPPANWLSHYLPAVNNTSAFTPSTQLYNSSDVNVFNWQVGQMKAAHQAVAISSWWGQGDPSDTNFNTIMRYMNPATSADPSNPYPNLRWAVYYEQEGYGDPSVAQIDSDLNYIKSHYANQPGYLKIGGKPVVFVYNAKDCNCADWWTSDVTRWRQARSDTGFYVNMKIDPVVYGGVSPKVVDGWHEYGPTSRADQYGRYYYMISPGFWREQDPYVLARDPVAFANAAKAMASASVTWKLTETWNEWIEGTSVEPGIDANWTFDGGPNNGQATQADSGFGVTSGPCTTTTCTSTTWVNTLGANLPPPS